MRLSLQTFFLFLLFSLPVISANAEDLEQKGRGRTMKASREIGPDKMVAHAMPEQSFPRANAMDMHSPNINNRFKEGIDVSHYQGWIDWQKVAGCSQISYVYLKATEGESFLDKTYVRNLKEAREAGLSVGSYHFYRPNINWELQFNNLTRNVTKNTQDLVPMIDIEVRGNVSEAKFLQDLQKFIKKVEDFYGKKPLLYTYQNFYNKHLVGQFKGYHWMMAKYQSERPVLTDNQDYIMWQYSATGSIPGVKGEVDRSRIMGDYTLKQLKM